MCRTDMARSKILIAGSTYIADKQAVELTKLWARLNETVNPDCDFLIVDSASPFAPQTFLKSMGYDYFRLLFDEEIPPEIGHRTVVSFGENIGHLSRGGKHGAGRAFCKALEIAFANGYHKVAIIEGDLLFAKPVAKVFERLESKKIKAATCWSFSYQFIESGAMFFDTLWLHQSEFVKRYDWKGGDQHGLPEKHLEDMCGDELYMLPYRGLRNDMDNITIKNMPEVINFGLDWITHCRDFRVYLKFLEMNGINLNA